jgi:NAD(P)-dependent dehydrogenase (short-subunit alcohol dehydrogenase family)
MSNGRGRVAVARIRADLGPIDIVVNNAEVIVGGKVEPCRSIYCIHQERGSDG